MIKKIKSLCILIILSTLFTSCTNSPTTRTVAEYIVPYGIIENGKVNRFEASENDTQKVNRILYSNYGISFHPLFFTIEAPIPTDLRVNSTDETYSIIFFDDWIVTVNEKKYIIPKDKIKEISSSSKKNSKNVNGEKIINHVYDPNILKKIDIRGTNDKFMNVDIGRISIVDKTGNIIKREHRIPSIVFRVAIIQKKINYLGKNETIIVVDWRENLEEYKSEPTVLRKGLNVVDTVLFKPMRAIQTTLRGD